MLQFDDSCYVDAKQYHLASFSTRNSTLNTSLRKPVTVQDFIQLCDSTQYGLERLLKFSGPRLWNSLPISITNSNSFRIFRETLKNSMLNCYSIN